MAMANCSMKLVVLHMKGSGIEINSMAEEKSTMTLHKQSQIAMIIQI